MRPETKTNYCETETETETKKVVSRPRWSRDLNIPEYHSSDVVYRRKRYTIGWFLNRLQMSV